MIRQADANLGICDITTNRWVPHVQAQCKVSNVPRMTITARHAAGDSDVGATGIAMPLAVFSSCQSWAKTACVLRFT